MRNAFRFGKDMAVGADMTADGPFAWMDKAACLDEDPELFFPSSTGVAAQRQAERAASVCERCPVQDRCAQHGREINSGAGIWGGTYHQTKPRPPLRPINHGTDGGYRTHLARGQEPCNACRSAHRYAERKRMMR